MSLEANQIPESTVERIAMTGDLYEIEPDGLVTLGFEFTPPLIGRNTEEWVEVIKGRFPSAIIRGSRTTQPKSKHDRRGNYAKGCIEVFFVLADD